MMLLYSSICCLPVCQKNLEFRSSSSRITTEKTSTNSIFFGSVPLRCLPPPSLILLVLVCFTFHSRCCCIPFKCSHRASHTTQSTPSSAIVIKIIDRIMVRCIRMEGLFSRRQEQVVLLLLVNFPVLLHLLFHSSAID